MRPPVVVVESDFSDPDETLAAYRRRVSPPRRPSLARRAVATTRRSPAMKKTAVVLALAAATFVAAVAPASAAKTCASGSFHGTDVEVTVWGSTSCAMGRAVARAAARRDFPYRVRVKSPVTHRYYTLHLDNMDDDDDYFSAVYVGHGRGRSTVNVQLQAWF